MGDSHAEMSLSDQQLLRGMRMALANGCQSDAEIIRFIAEIDRRKLYREQACSSMFKYCVDRLNMSEGAAYRRIKVARLSRELPGVVAYLEDGRIHLAGLYMLAPHLTPSNADPLLQRAVGKTQKQIERLVAELAPKPDVKASLRKLPSRGHAAVHSPRPELAGVGQANTEALSRAACPERLSTGQADLDLNPPGLSTPPTGSAPDTGLPGGDAEQTLPARAVQSAKPAKMRPLAPARFHVQFTAGEELRNKLERAKELAGHGATLESLVEDAMALLVTELEKEKLGVAGRKPGRVANPRGRYIAKAIRREVYERDGGQCTFVDERGRRCGERRGLHFDHVVPHARGGTSSADNLRLRCGPHNQLHAERCFGPLFMANKRTDPRDNAPDEPPHAG